MPNEGDKDAQRLKALEILRRAPLDFSRRASYGSEQRTERVTLHWADGRQSSLSPSRDDRISFALRDRFEREQPNCREQILQRVDQFGLPEAATVAWSYEADWEGAPPLSETGRQRIRWLDLAKLLALPAEAGAGRSVILGPMQREPATAKELEADVLARLQRYVRIDTQSQADSTSYPSTPGQLDLLRLLRDELLQLGYRDATLGRFGYVTATLPSTLPPTAAQPPVIGFFAHVDTSPDAPGKDVLPIVWPAYAGGDLVLPGDPTQVLSPADSPQLATHVGHDIVTSDGRTLLGADDKAGVAAAMAAAAYLIRHPEIQHGVIKFAFNPDEEVGRGVDHFDVAAFGAAYAYTLDAGDAGEVEDETFSADAVTLRFFGRSAHPGYAKGKLTNAIKIAGEFVAALAGELPAPEETAGRDGFVHPAAISGVAEEATVKLIVREFETANVAAMEARLRDLAEKVVQRHPAARYAMTVSEQYRNMRDVLVNHPRVTALADAAVRRVGLEPAHRPIRGGTDGARLCAMGLPTPNIFAGWQMIHSRREWVSVQDMGKAAAVIIELSQLWANEPA